MKEEIMIKCPRCLGDGQQRNRPKSRYPPWITCSRCGGKGKIPLKSGAIKLR